MEIKVGDKVRFLNATGGGVVTSVAGKRVTVEDEDGFPSDYGMNEVVVVSKAGDDVMSRSTTKESVAVAAGETTMSVKKRMQAMAEEEDDETETTRAETKEEVSSEKELEDEEDEIFTDDLDTEEGERLSVFLAFESRDLDKAGTDGVVAYLVNDSNYDLMYIVATTKDGKGRLQSAGKMESHTRFEFKNIAQSEINEWSHVSVQLIAMKPKKEYTLKHAFEVELKIAPVRFFRRGSYVPNDFFDNDVMTVNVVNNDVPDNAVMEPEVAEKKVVEEKETVASVREERRKVTSLARKEVGNATAGEVIVVDLQAEKLIGDVTAMAEEDVLSMQIAEMRRVMERNKKRDGQKIVFIEGKNERLRKEMRDRLKMEYPTAEAENASQVRYGNYATEVTVRKQ